MISLLDTESLSQEPSVEGAEGGIELKVSDFQ